MSNYFLVLSAMLLLAAGLYHLGGLPVLNALMPKDAAQLVVRGVRYGDDPRQSLDIYAPEGRDGPLPVVVFVHGGAWTSGSKLNYSFAGRALAARGFLALVINYRLHPKNPYPAFVQDTANAIAWAVREAWRLGGDPTRVFAVGHSAGAYNVLQAMLNPKFVAAAELPPDSVRGVIGLAGAYDFLPLDVAISLEVFGDVPDLADTQPVNHVRAGAPPSLFLHGASDLTALPRNSQSLHRALEAAGAKSTLKLYPNLGHPGILLALSKPFRHWAPVLDDIEAFVRDSLK